MLKMNESSTKRFMILNSIDISMHWVEFSENNLARLKKKKS